MSPNDLNTEIIDDLKDVLGDGFLNLVDVQLEQAEEYLATIQLHIENDNIEQVQSTAHSLKSSAGQVGLLGIYELSRQLEYEAKQKGHECQRLYNELKAAYPKAVEHLHAYVTG